MSVISFVRHVLLAECWALICAEYNAEFGHAESLQINPPTHAPSALDGSYEVSLGKPTSQSSIGSQVVNGGLPGFAVNGDSDCCSVARSAQLNDPW